jgi:hypothetical protein
MQSIPSPTVSMTLPAMTVPLPPGTSVIPSV